MKNLPLGANLFREDRQTYIHTHIQTDRQRYDKRNVRFSQFCGKGLKCLSSVDWIWLRNGF